MSIMKKLYNGEFNPAETIVPKSVEYIDALHAQDKAHTVLLQSLSDEQKELLEEYCDAHIKTALLIQTEIFKESFKLGFQFNQEITNKADSCL